MNQAIARSNFFTTQDFLENVDCYGYTPLLTTQDSTASTPTVATPATPYQMLICDDANLHANLLFGADKHQAQAAYNLEKALYAGLEYPSPADSSASAVLFDLMPSAAAAVAAQESSVFGEFGHLQQMHPNLQDFLSHPRGTQDQDWALLQQQQQQESQLQQPNESLLSMPYRTPLALTLPHDVYSQPCPELDFPCHSSSVESQQPPSQSVSPQHPQPQQLQITPLYAIEAMSLPSPISPVLSKQESLMAAWASVSMPASPSQQPVNAMQAPAAARPLMSTGQVLPCSPPLTTTTFPSKTDMTMYTFPTKFASGHLSDSDDYEEDGLLYSKRQRVKRISRKAENDTAQLLKLNCPHPGCKVVCSSYPSMTRHTETHKWRGLYAPVRCEGCQRPLSNEFSAQRHILRAMVGTRCRTLRAYSVMRSNTEVMTTFRFTPNRPHGKKTVAIGRDVLLAKYP